jgi:hypothetical protein
MVDPAVTWSVKDVADGLRWGLEQAGVECRRYHLGARIEREDRWLAFMRDQEIAERQGAGDETPVPAYTPADVCYRASVGLLERTFRLAPDWVFLMCGMFFHPDVLVYLRRAGVKVALFLTESPYEDEQQSLLASLANVVFTNERVSADSLRTVNPQTYYVAHAFHVERHTPNVPVPDDTPRHDIVFVGTGWPERVELVQKMDRSYDIGLYGTWDALKGTELEPLVKNGVTDNARAVELYRAAKMGINLHRRHVTAESLNPRCFELAATGCFFVSDHRAELTEIFGDLVPTFLGAAELDALVRRWLPDEVGRQRVARELVRRVANHSWRTRAQTVYDALVRAEEQTCRASITVQPAAC